MNQPEISQNAKEKLTGLKINNLPKNISEEEVLKFLKENVKKDLDIVNFDLTPHTTRNNASITIFSGLKPEDIMAAIDKIDFKLGKQKFLEKPLYCKALRTLTPSKENEKKGEDSEEKQRTRKKRKKVNLRKKMIPTKRIKTKINMKKHLIN